jgi:uncharacterized membrane protein
MNRDGGVARNDAAADGQPRSARLERTIGEVLRFGTIASSTMFAIGLLMTVMKYQTAVAGLLLNAGLIILLATPPARVIVSVIEYVRERDWAFVTLTFIVLLALGGSVIAAYF